MGIKVFMLTGDSREVAGWVAGDLRIDEYFAQVLPHQKAEKITALKEKGFRVAMVGDGINDAPALATADVGIAFGAGTDVAIESADIILVRSDPRDVTKAIELARETYFKMVENLWWAAGYNLVAIPLAAGVLAPYGLVISPALGAIVMSLSTIIVALNAQTLRKYEPKSDAFAPTPVEKDPVCGMEVSTDSLYKTEFEGRMIYFCSEHCMWEFNRNPEKFRRKLPKR
jgi:Cu2+-exporting ATPase